MSFLASDTFWVGVGLAVFVAILAYMGVHKMLLGALDERAGKITAELDEARRLREEATSVLAQYKAKQAEAEQEAKAMLDAAKQEAKRLKAEAKTKVEEFVTRRTQQAELKIAQAEQQAVAEVRSAATDVAVSAASQVVGTMASGKAGAEMVSKGIAGIKTLFN